MIYHVDVIFYPDTEIKRRARSIKRRAEEKL
jgi:hypothetical protein